MTTDPTTNSEYDPFAEQTLLDPFGAHAELRELCPVHLYPDFGERGFYSLAQYEDVEDLFRDVDRWSADWGQGPIYVKEGGLKSDPPVHTFYRRLITGAFTAKRTAAMEPEIRNITNALIDSFVQRGAADLGSEFAVPLPIKMIGTLIGVREKDFDSFKAWSDEFMAGQNAADPEVQRRARGKIDTYFQKEISRRRALIESASEDARLVGDVLDDDILTSLLLADDGGRALTDEELLPLLLLLLVGGNETTTSLIGNMVSRLLQLGLWNDVVQDESLWDVAVEESLRFDPPVLGMFRTANGDQEVKDVTIPDEAKVEGLLASANRDEGAWEDPNAFRLDRDVPTMRKKSMSFGIGIWLCPAAALARLEARVALECLGQRLPNLRLDGPTGRVESFMMWGPQRVPVTWDAG